ncbi:MAG: hypothetical protein LBL82_01620 [Oscillospiraceae bacterium]|jgi:hypothetical protein|nr:hypothetical protein [Oscillospiraceae bacterium]
MKFWEYVLISLSIIICFLIMFSTTRDWVYRIAFSYINPPQKKKILESRSFIQKITLSFVLRNYNNNSIRMRVLIHNVNLSCMILFVVLFIVRQFFLNIQNFITPFGLFLFALNIVVFIMDKNERKKEMSKLPEKPMKIAIFNPEKLEQTYYFNINIRLGFSCCFCTREKSEPEIDDYTDDIKQIESSSISVNDFLALINYVDELKENADSLYENSSDACWHYIVFYDDKRYEMDAIQAKDTAMQRIIDKIIMLSLIPVDLDTVFDT